MHFFRNSLFSVALLMGVVLLLQGSGSIAFGQSKPQKGVPQTDGKKNQRPTPMTEEEKEG